MKIKNLFKSLLSAVVCLSLITGSSVAQQPFGSSAGEGDTESAQDEPGAIIRPSRDSTPRRNFEEPQDTETAQGQAILLNVKYAGWESTTGNGNGAQRIGNDLRTNWIMVDPNGRFEGTVHPGAGADVTNMNVFLMNMGRLVKQTALNSEGRFEFNNVRQGAYALIGWGDKGFFAFGLNILSNNPDSDGSIENALQISAYQNATTINTDWIHYYASQVSYRVFGRYPTGEGRDDPASLYGFMGQVREMPTGVPATSISNHAIAKTADGRLVGRVHQLNSLSGRPVDVRTTKVMLLQGDDVVASTTTDNYGVFEFQQVPDGSYGLAAAGVDGVGLISINVGTTDADIDAEPANIDFTLISSETIGWLNHYASEVAYRRALLAPRQPSPIDQVAGAGVCPQCGNMGGGCNTCQNAYNGSNCSSRGISFEQWQQMGCQCQTQKLGDGKIISDITRQIRKNTKKIDNAFERAFYPNDFDNNGYNQNQYNQNQNGYNQNQYNGGYGQPNYGN